MMKFLSKTRQWGLPRFLSLLSLCILFALSTESVKAQGPVNATWTATNVSCAGFANGEITLIPTGGSGTYLYQWFLTGGTGITESGLDKGMHQVSIIDAADPTNLIFLQIPITEPDVLVAAFTANSHPTCFDICDGTADLEITGGTPPYSFSWPAGATLSNNDLHAEGLCDGIIQISVTDAMNCSTSATQALNNPNPIVATTSTSTMATCAGNDGVAKVIASDGLAPYFYLWSNGETTQEITGLVPDTYTVDITDSGGCTAQTSVVITGVTSTMTASISPFSDITCNGFANGSATANVSGGTAPYTFVWSVGTGIDGPSSSTANDLPFGAGTVTVTDANSCTEVLNFNIDEPAAIVVTVNATGDISCPGATDGTASINIAGGVGPFSESYLNNDTGIVAANNTSLPVGNYTVTVEDTMNPGCTATANFVIDQPAPIVASTVSVSDISCNGATDGSITISVTGGTMDAAGNSTLFYVWMHSLSETGPTASNLAPGTYTVNIFDAAGCTESITEIINDVAPIGAVMDPPSHISCFNANDGSAKVVVSGGTPPYSFDWQDGVNFTDIATGLTPGIHTVLISDSSTPPCTTSADVTIDDAIQITGTISDTDESCYAYSDGTATVDVLGGEAPYTFTWSAGIGTDTATGSIATGLPAGPGTVTVLDNKGCSEIFNFDIAQATQIVVTADPANPSCPTGGDGSVLVNASGGSGSFAYEYFDAAGVLVTTGGTASETGFLAGSYTVSVSETANPLCLVSVPFDIIDPAAISASLGTVNDVSCFGKADGSIEVIASGGTAPLTYSWSPSGGSDAIASNLGPGIYDVTITDGSGCSTNLSKEIFEPTAMSAIADPIAPITCATATDGSATVTVTGGEAPFQYAWSVGTGTNDGTAVSTANDLPAGPVTVTITDNKSCETFVDFNIDPVGPIVPTVTPSDVSCPGVSDGSVAVMATGGSGAFDFTFEAVAAPGVPVLDTGLAAGDYIAIIAETSNPTCFVSEAFTIGSPSEIIESLDDVTNVSCNGAADGSITVSATGGTDPLTYLWSPSGGTGQTESNLGPGFYTVTITDNKGCFKEIKDIEITQPDPMAVTVTDLQDVSCNGLADGEVTIAVSGGSTGGYSVSWSPSGGSSETETGLVAGDYTYTVTDNLNGACLVTDIITIAENPPITGTVDFTPISCAGACDAVATTNITGGFGTLYYDWGSDDPNALCAGMHTVVVSDDKGCSEMFDFTIDEGGQLVLDIQKTNVSCNGAADGTATVNVSGNVVPISSTVWSDSTGPVNPAALSGGTYDVLVTDENGCFETGSVTIDEATELMGDCMSTTNSVEVSVSGGAGDYTYSWDGLPDTTPKVENLSPGSYMATVTDKDGCFITIPCTIADCVDPLVITFDIEDVSCNGKTDGEVTVNVSGGQAPYTFAYTGGISSTTNTAVNLAADSYVVTVTDATTLCMGSETFVINEPDALYWVTECDLVTGGDGSITVEAMGGNVGTLSYQWDDPMAQTGQTATGLTPGNTYTVTVTDSKGCQDTSTCTLPNPGCPIVVITHTDIDCFGDTDGTASVDVSGGAGPYGYTWSANDTGTKDVTGLPAGTISVTVTDTNGCSDVYTAEILGPSAALDFDGLCNVTDMTSATANDGIVTVTVLGGTPPYDYDWGAASTDNSNSLTGLSVGTYTVTVTDSKGCSNTQTCEIPVIAPTGCENFTVTGTETHEECFEAANGEINLSVDSAVPGLSYSWTSVTTTPASGANPTGLEPGEYTVTVTSSSTTPEYCPQTEVFTILPADQFTATATADQPCDGTGNNEINVALTGGTGPFTYVWTDLVSTSNVANNLPPKMYDIEITDALGCKANTQAEIKASPIRGVTISAAPLLCGMDMLELTFVDPEGTGAIIVTYTINGTEFTSDPLSDGVDHTITIDSSPYTASGQIEIIVTNIKDDCGNDNLNDSKIINHVDDIEIVSISDPVCATGNATFTVTIEVNGGTGNYSVDPTSAGTFVGSIFTSSAITSGDPTDFSFTISDDSGCTGESFDLKHDCDCETVGGTIGLTPIHLCEDEDATIVVNGAPNLDSDDSSFFILHESNTGTITDAIAISQTGEFKFAAPMVLGTTYYVSMVVGNSHPTTGVDLTDACTTISAAVPITFHPPTDVNLTASICNTSDGVGSVLDLNSLIIIGNTDGTWTDTDASGAAATGSSYDFVGISDGTYSFNYSTPIDAACGLQSFDVVITVEDCTTTTVIPSNEVCPTVLTTAEVAEGICEGETVDLTLYESMITYDDPDSKFDGIAWFADAAHSQSVVTSYTPEYTESCDPQLITVYPGILCDISGQIVAAGAIDITVYPIATGALELNSDGCQMIAQLDCPNYGFDGDGTFQTLPEDFTEVSLEIYNNDAVAAGLTSCRTTLVNSFDCDELIKYISLPNAFSPNGDGLNDFFHPLEMTGVSSVNLKVYNRWGQEVYSTQDMYHQGWDGTFQGVDQDIGVYAYIMNATFFDGKQKMLKGNVTLIK